jgi:hypothetical protein
MDAETAKSIAAQREQQNIILGKNINYNDQGPATVCSDMY